MYNEHVPTLIAHTFSHIFNITQLRKIEKDQLTICISKHHNNNHHTKQQQQQTTTRKQTIFQHPNSFCVYIQMTNFSYKWPSEARHLCCFLFQFSGSVWGHVLPYCLLNCGTMALVEWLAINDVRIAFPMQGHTLMTLLISYLVVAKINLSYDRYMKARYSIGNALSSLRELHQLAMTYTHSFQYNHHHHGGSGGGDKNAKDDHPNNNIKNEMVVASRQVHKWRVKLTERIIDLMDCTIRVIRSEEESQHLARNQQQQCFQKGMSNKTVVDDPLLHVQALRLHLYSGKVPSKLQLLERVKLNDMLDGFARSYRELLALASTPLPFPLVQMARTFLFLWTFTIPFVLRGVIDEAFVAMIFVFFLTYGFIGLELVSVKLVHPFGDGANDLNVTGMREATIQGLERDLEMFGQASNMDSDRRLEFSRQQARKAQWSDESSGDDTPTTFHSPMGNSYGGGGRGSGGTVGDTEDCYNHSSGSMYIAMSHV